MNINRVIHILRISKGLKQLEVAKATGIPNSVLSGIENGTRKPGNSHLEKLSKFYDVPIPILMFLAFDPNEVPLESRGRFLDLHAKFKSLINQELNLDL